ncbi:helix-turn-helix domain-containing protein [Paenibacillus chungangensis]|uniref:Helix-turn-helix domain-containing protein n=1 Tax=Paenibacillus chungangensis TaxID=696535 RepID=A0ABW3HNC3_9BACL
MLSINTINKHQGMNWYEEQFTTDSSSLMNHATYAQLVIMTYGKCLYWLNGEKTLAERGDFLFIPAQLSYYGKSIPTVFHEKYVIQFNIGRTDAIPLLATPSPKISKPGIYEMCVDRLKMVWKEWQDGTPYASARVEAFLVDTLALWNRELDHSSSSSMKSDNHVVRMKQYIANHYRNKITKIELGDCIGRSPNHAASLFRQGTGQTISQYIHHTRMRTAQYLLRESLLNITEIAEYLGYSEVSYFQRIFKRTFGYPPSVSLTERSSQ